MYYSDRREAGGQGWWTDYSAADVNFSIRLSELTKTRVSKTADGQPNHLVVRLTDDELFQCPFVEMEDVGTARFSDEEVKRLRQYLLKGGFIWVDDFWGEEAWWQWVEEIQRVLPKKDFPIRPIAPDHPIFRTLFQVSKLPQIPSIAHWRRSGGETSERGAESAVPADVRHQRRARSDHGADDAQHRYLRRVGTRGRGPAVLLPVLPRRVCGRAQCPDVFDDPLRIGLGELGFGEGGLRDSELKSED